MNSGSPRISESSGRGGQEILNLCGAFGDHLFTRRRPWLFGPPSESESAAATYISHQIVRDLVQASISVCVCVCVCVCETVPKCANWIQNLMILSLMPHGVINKNDYQQCVTWHITSSCFFWLLCDWYHAFWLVSQLGLRDGVPILHTKAHKTDWISRNLI